VGDSVVVAGSGLASVLVAGSVIMSGGGSGVCDSSKGEVNVAISRD
jgi:hypothetical protein